MPPEVIENQNQPPPVKVNHKNPLVVILVIGLILLAAGLIYLGRKYGAPPAPEAPAAGGLTEAEKAEILKSLALPPGAKPLTQAEKNEILKSLQLPPNTPPLTEAEKAEILKSLK
ncbi:MAG: hypothetical protein HYT46_00455 [Candidatus Vogelbacteria bacterium]|nr:hypothetical protein [Candidatus Vogelbacteria bacterium]